jgi:hypothetical protein
MSDSIVLIRLREIRDMLADLKDDFSEMKLRVTTLETQVGNLGATEQSHYASVAMRLDRIGGDVDRIKRRLELADEPAH